MRNIIVKEKKFLNDYHSIDPWGEEKPFFPPGIESKITLYFVTYAFWESKNFFEITFESGTNLINYTNDLLSNFFIIKAPFNWQDEGFVKNKNFIIFLVNDAGEYAFIEAIIKDLINTNCIAEGISASHNIAIKSYTKKVAFFQNLSDIPLQSVIAKKELLQSDFNFNSLEGNHPDKGIVQYNYPSSGTIYINMPNWGLGKYLEINVQRQIISIANLLHMQDGYDFFAKYPNYNFFNDTAYLNIGLPGAFVSYPIISRYPNHDENGNLINTNIYIENGNIIVEDLPIEFVEIKRVLTYYTGTDGHLSHAKTSIDLLQYDTQVGNTIRYTEKDYLLGIVLAFHQITGEYFIFTTKPKPLTAEIIDLDITISDMPLQGANMNFSNYKRRPQKTYPWDAVATKISIIKPDTKITRITSYFAFINENTNTGYTGEIHEATDPFLTLEDLPSNLNYDRLFFTFSLAEISYTGINTFISYFPAILKLNSTTYMARNYLAKYINKKLNTLTIYPDNIGSMLDFAVYLCISLETNKGIFTKKFKLNSFQETFTNLCEFEILPDFLKIKIPPYTANENDLKTHLWLVSLHEGELSSYPLKQWIYGQNNQIWQKVIENNYEKNTFLVPRNFEKETGTFYYYIRFVAAKIINGKHIVISDEIAEYKKIIKKDPTFALYENITLSDKCDCPPLMPILASETNLKIILPPKTDNDLPPAGDFQTETLPNRSYCWDNNIKNFYPGLQLVNEIQEDYIDILLYFDNKINNLNITGSHFFRIQGILKRIDDEVENESYVTLDYKKLDIWRSISQKYELELFVKNKEYLWSTELLKFSKFISVLTRKNNFIKKVENLIYENSKITDNQTALIFTATLRTAFYRHEYRYK